MKKEKKHRFLRYFLFFVLLAGGFSIVFFFSSLPSVDSITDHVQIPSVQILDRNERLLYELIPGYGRNTPLSAEALPQCLKDATIAVEDKNFYTNSGVDIAGIVRAVWINFESDGIVSGGSTITQQLARNMLLGENERFEKTFSRKLREAVLALQLTQRYSKDEILALYLNQMYYGGLSYGVEAVSQTYFGKPAAELMLPECALVAGLPQAPSYYDPYTNPESVLARQKVVLGLMEQEGFITSEEREFAENYTFSFNSSPYPIHAPHFVWMVENQLDQLYEEGVIKRSQSIKIRTTLDLNYQEIAEGVIARQIERFEKPTDELEQNVNNAAMVVLDPSSGQILAMVGSLDYFDGQINGAVNMATSPRQTGSALKPFLYALALDPSQAEPWTAATPLFDVSTTFQIRDGKTYIPSNYDKLEHGIVSVRKALGSSLNIPAVLTLEKVGVGNTISFLRQLGVTSLVDPKNYDLSLALGGGQISLLELTSAYGTFANGGIYYEDMAILDIHTPEGEVLYSAENRKPKSQIDPRIAWMISDVLSDDAAREIGFGLNSTLKIDRPAAVKTGTTTNFHDNWTIGYTPSLVVGVWVGNTNFEAMHDVTGLTGAAPIWHETMRTLLQGKAVERFERPSGIVREKVCVLSGLLPSSACQNVRSEWFMEETVPTETDAVYQEVVIDAFTGQLATDDTPTTRQQAVIAYDLPEGVADWARDEGWLLVSDLIENEAVGRPTTMIRLTSPQPKTVFRIEPNFDYESQQILLEADTDESILSVSFWADGVMLARMEETPYQTWWQLSLGEHEFWVEGQTRDGSDYSSDVIRITVVEE